MKKIILFLGILAISYISQAQTECTTYHRKGCGEKNAAPMKYDTQSKSAIMAKGQVSEFHMIAYNGQDYRVTVCHEENLGGEVKYKIYEKQKVLIKPKAEEDYQESAAEETSDEYSSDDYSEDDYSEDNYDDYSDESYSEEAAAIAKKGPKFKIVKELLYDNSQDGYSPFIEFTAEGSMSLIIEVSVPGSESKMKLKVRETGCVGVLIEHVKSKKTGF